MPVCVLLFSCAYDIAKRTAYLSPVFTPPLLSGSVYCLSWARGGTGVVATGSNDKTVRVQRVGQQVAGATLGGGECWGWAQCS
jgi:hypothetical protein